MMRALRPSLSVPFALAVTLLTACSGEGKDDGDTLVGDPPDVTGRYNVATLTAPNGCDGDISLIDWAQGPLTIEGTPDALSFDFGDEKSFSGAVGASFQFSFSGDATLPARDTGLEVQLGVYCAGSFSSGSTGWTMDGEFEVEVDDDEFTTNNCTFSATMGAVEL